MKRSILIFALLLNVALSFAIDTNVNFGFKKQENPNGYQQYVGKSFFFRPAYDEFETWRNSGFKYNDSYEGKTFTISMVTVRDIKLNDKPNKEITIVAIETGGKKKIKFKSYEELTARYSAYYTERWPVIDCMPIVFVEPFNEYKKDLVGKTISNELVKDIYEIVDVFIGENKKLKMSTRCVRVKNKRTGEEVSCPYSDVNTIPFADALTGSYKTALIKVEKPEDATNRYGETKTIQEEGIDKYSYNDKTIDIIIFGTKEQFSFVLKNVSDHSLKVIWNEAVFVGLDGSTSKIMHVGTKYSQREGDQPATVVIKGAKIDDVATPTANVYYDEGVKIGYSTIGSGWKTKSMLPEDYLGKDAGEIRLMLPIQIKDVVNEYTFVFKVYYTYDHPELLNTEKL